MALTISISASFKALAACARVTVQTCSKTISISLGSTPSSSSPPSVVAVCSVGLFSVVSGKLVVAPEIIGKGKDYLAEYQTYVAN